MGSSIIVYWLSETWEMGSTYSPDRALTGRRTLNSERRPDYSDTDERAAIRR
ncbi:hypothetical protein NP493_334g00023 [Ridgeia piscesae]|uniref:Uncharacterized protein n=1 Tax=Ridgeia piscesae TaxID=27915 RepID=A0AAD9L4R3_RIDPI|nr:hypothetical protein NP493_334g00023 [Ridgeia piscesae]